MGNRAEPLMASAAIKDDVRYLESWGAFAEKAGLIPQGTSQYQAMAIVQAGKEMGLQPLQSLRTMSFVRGRLVMSVQLQLALAKNTKGVKILNLSEDNESCEVTLSRGGEEEITCRYTVDDAKKAGLVKPDGNWLKYQRQMLRWRAIGDALRIICPDLVMGLLSLEEAASIEEFIPDVKTNKPVVSAPQAKQPEAEAVIKPTEAAQQLKTTARAIEATYVSAIVSKSGKNTAGKPWTKYKISTNNGDYYTFSESLMMLAKSAQDGGCAISITFKSDEKYGNTIENIELIEPDLGEADGKGI